MATKKKMQLPELYKGELYSISIIRIGKKGKVTVKYAQRNKHSNFVDMTFSSPERTHPDFDNAVAALIGHAVIVWGLNSEIRKITKLTFNKKKDGANTLALDCDIAIEDMPDDPAQMHLPAKPEFIEGAEGTACLSQELMAAAIIARNEAVLAIEGKCSQEDLFDDGEAEEED